MSGYSLLLGLGLVVSSPWWIARMLTTSRYREGLRERLGAVPQRLREAVAGRRVVWLHAVSVGEVLAASGLIAQLEPALNASEMGGEPWTVVISTTTRTGQALARERFGAGRVFYFPLDFAWAVRAWLRALRPAMVVLVESELWPRLLHECAREGVPVAVVNARMSDRSFRRAWRVRRIWGKLLRSIDLFLAQSEETAHRLLALGARPDAVRVSGNLKYDVRAPRESRLTAMVGDLARERPVVIAGSTVEAGDPLLDEDRLVIQAWEGSPRREHRALLVLAPRHPERFADVHAVALEFPTMLATDLIESGPRTAGAELVQEQRETEILVLNTIGDLASLYSVADVAFVGGSLVPRGGHNPLEPAQFGVPVVMGPSFENFRDVVNGMMDADAIRIVRDRDELQKSLSHLLQNRGAAEAMGDRGRKVFEREGGATARSVEGLLALIRSREPAGKQVPA